MVDMDNFSEINQNFDTIKTLLNSIRAQGILNTSDVDKLLTGINTKLEKINTEEDIDLIKIFLSELKQNLDERHSMLLSKFGAIESLFTNLLKNSSEMPKSSDIKELFDIVATNLSVFSREVVAQKDTLTDITLRLDAIRSDDSQKKDIIKNIAILRPDLERLNNGFDSIVISLNDNFKTIIKTITSIDRTDYLEKFGDNLKNIEMSSNTILSALQMLNKKSEQVEDSIQKLVTKDDLTFTNKHLVEISAQNQELVTEVSNISERYTRIDNLADKVDASVNIIVNLKSLIEEIGDKQSSSLLEQLRGLEELLKQVNSESRFNEFKQSLEIILKNISENNLKLDSHFIASSKEVQKVIDLINSLEINVNMQDLLASINKVETSIKDSINSVSQKLIDFQDTNVTRVLSDISTEAEVLGSKINQTQSAIAILCEKNFASVAESVTDLKNLVSQVDENSVSANNAIFSSITDRLTLFENSLRNSLVSQEKSVTTSTSQLMEQVDNIKNLTNILDYKMDSSVVEVENAKREFSTLKDSIKEILALDFVNTVKDLRVDLYASKQELEASFENVNNDLSEKIINDLYGKYELLISKLDSVEDEFKRYHATSLVDLKLILEKISSSIIDVLSYVSEAKPQFNDELEQKIANISAILKENNLDYVESVRDVVDVIRVQVENNLKLFEAENSNNFDLVKRTISENSDELKKELKFSYSKLLEIQDYYNEIKEIINVNNLDAADKFNNVISTTENIRFDFENKMSNLKAALLDNITDFKQEFTCENADKVSELKFSLDNFYNKNTKDVSALIESLKEHAEKLADVEEDSRSEALKKIIENFSTVQELINSLKNYQEQALSENTNALSLEISNLQNSLSEFKKVQANDFEEKVSSVSSKIVEVKDLINSLNDVNVSALSEKTDVILADFMNVKSILERVDENIDGDMTRQLSIIESNFESLVSQITILFDKSEKSLTDKINDEFNSVSEKLQGAISEKLEQYKIKIEETFEGIQTKSEEQSQYLQDKIANLNTVLRSIWDEQAEDNKTLIEEIADGLKSAIDENIKLTAVDYVALKNKLTDFAKNIESNNQSLTSNLTAQIEELTKYVDSRAEIQNQEIGVKYENLISGLNDTNSIIKNSVDSVKEISEEQLSLARNSSADLSALTQMCANNNNLVENLQNLTCNQVDLLKTQNDIALDVTKNIETTVLKTSDDINNIKNDVKNLSIFVTENKELLANIESDVIEKISALELKISNDATEASELINASADKVLVQLEAQKQYIELSKDFLFNSFKKELNLVSDNIEKETDVIIAELIEQFELLKKAQADDVINLTSRIEDIVNTHIYNNIEDLKSYLDIKTDNSTLSNKLDNIKAEISVSIEEIVNNLTKLLETSVFADAMSDFRVANELLINTSVDRLNKQIQAFVQENGESIEDKLAIFDKKFVETVVDKFEEIKIISNQYNSAFEEIQTSISSILGDFETVKAAYNDRIENLTDTLKDAIEITTNEVRALNDSFENLRSQISNKSFDEAFQASINKQIGSLENLISEQMSYLEDINSLCSDNLPDVTELNTLVKHSILESINEFSQKLDANNIEEQLNQIKTDIITQFINVFNQLSFVTEQEEILDFIQEKHQELINLVSHVVTTAKDVKAINTKIDSVKDDINTLNKKINAIISSDEDIDYIYSLQDLESDIANLRLVLNEMKENGQGQELAELIESTNNIYKLVEAFPNKSDFEAMAEDIVSISSRTNKLILASDESYKTLQDNLQDFKLVINDLDERTRNFAEESGMNRIDTKLNAINSMMVNGAKTNQVFNQVFEYLAEWVDNAGVQINSISDKIETLGEIGQIKDMLIDLKAGAEDNTESEELVEALGSVFEKQAKRISALETKIDRVIVETTINNQNNKLDMTPLEETLNKFLVAMDEKISAQQAKIDSLETKLEDMTQILEDKDTATLTKKVGGMDRQIAKLNKSIEKIASHVVEK